MISAKGAAGFEKPAQVPLNVFYDTYGVTEGVPKGFGVGIGVVSGKGIGVDERVGLGIGEGDGDGGGVSPSEVVESGISTGLCFFS